MKDLTIRTRITIWFIVVIIVLLAVNFVVFFSIGENVARKTAREDLGEIVRSNMREVSFQRGDPPQNQKAKTTNYTIKFDDGYLQVDDFLDFINGVASGLYSPDGDLLYGLDLLPNETKDLEFVDGTIRKVEAGEDTFYILDRFLNIDEKKGIWIRGMVDRAQDREQVYRMYRIYLLIVPFIILIAALIGYIITYRALSPLDRIAEEVSHINRESDLKYRVDIDTGNNEVGLIVSALNSMLSRLEESYERNRKFTSNISHDLRTPITVISAQTELALDQEMSEELREAFETIQRQTKRTSDMLDSQLTYMRLEDMSMMYEITDINLSRIAESTCKSFRAVSDSEVKLEESIAEDLMIKGNESLVYSMLENLISNAFRYSDEGTVRVEVYEEDGRACVSISDEGIGIPAADIDRIFEWRYRSENSRNGEGTGIGLFVVKMIVDMHDADIKVESEPGKGSRFTVYFRGNEDDDGE